MFRRAFEPNDHPDHAWPMVIDFDESLTTPPCDADWFTFALADARTSVATGETSMYDEHFNAIMAVFDEALATQDSSDDAPYPDPRIEIGLPAGTYLLAVTGSGDVHFAGYHDWEHVRHRLAVTSMP